MRRVWMLLVIFVLINKEFFFEINNKVEFTFTLSSDDCEFSKLSILLRK